MRAVSAALEPLRAELQRADPAELFLTYLADALARMPEPVAAGIVHGLLSAENRLVRQRGAEALKHRRVLARLVHS